MKQRQQFIKNHISPEHLKIVEIGALDAPTFKPLDYDIRFIDYATKSQLMADNPNNTRYAPEVLVDVDYPVIDLKYSEHIDERFDLVIANHVIEHIPNTIQWFKELHNILNPSSYIFMSIPDRRYTFDYLRPETTIADVLRTFYNKVSKPDFFHIFEHSYYYRDIKKKDAWDGSFIEKIMTPRQTISQAFQSAEKFSKLPYASVHCHVYTYDSFLRLFSEIKELGLVQFSIVDSADVSYGRNEFHVLLRKN